MFRFPMFRTSWFRPLWGLTLVMGLVSTTVASPTSKDATQATADRSSVAWTGLSAALQKSYPRCFKPSRSKVVIGTPVGWMRKVDRCLPNPCLFRSGMRVVTGAT